ncbi:MAG: hypothetical protein K6E68_06745 [Lachnospiraceae bacterium]|nr:hypothetical protein [Lachnospiraceae bacterium]
MKSPKGVKGFIIILILVLLIVGYYYYLSNRNYRDRKEAEVVVTPAQSLLLLNFDINYPPTPKEVVKQYMEFSKVLHNEDLTDEEIEAVGLKLLEILDDDLVANKTREDYIKDLKSELKTFKDNDYAIVNMYTSQSTDVDFFEVEGRECSSLYGTFSIRTDSGTQLLQDIFILRKDDNGHWKIYGWQPQADSPE